MPPRCDFARTVAQIMHRFEFELRQCYARPIENELLRLHVQNLRGFNVCVAR